MKAVFSLLKSVSLVLFLGTLDAPAQVVSASKVADVASGVVQPDLRS